MDKHYPPSLPKLSTPIQLGIISEREISRRGGKLYEWAILAERDSLSYWIRLYFKLDWVATFPHYPGPEGFWRSWIKRRHSKELDSLCADSWCGVSCVSPLYWSMDLNVDSYLVILLSNLIWSIEKNSPQNGPMKKEVPHKYLIGKASLHSVSSGSW